MVRTVYFICVNFNNAKFTNKFLESVFWQECDTKINLTAIVVDNASNLDDYRLVQSYCYQYPKTLLIRSETNLGYFGGLNLGLENISPSNLDYVVIGNNDLIFHQNFVMNLVMSDYENNVLVIAPNVITRDGYHQNPHCVRRMSWFRKFTLDIYFCNYLCARILTVVAHKLKKLGGGRKNQLSDISQLIHMGIGACYVLCPSYFNHYSRLDDSVFLYGEEALLAGQLMAVDGKLFYDVNLVVTHDESATLSLIPSRTTYGFGKKSYPYYRKYL